MKVKIIHVYIDLLNILLSLVSSEDFFPSIYTKYKTFNVLSISYVLGLVWLGFSWLQVDWSSVLCVF